MDRTTLLTLLRSVLLWIALECFALLVPAWPLGRLAVLGLSCAD